MKKSILFGFLLFFCAQVIYGQEGFHFDTNKNKITIPFQFINNLIIIPVTVNGVSMNFLLDTGVEETVLFSLDDTNEVSFSKLEKIKIRGLGSNADFDGFKSVHNNLVINNYIDLNHDIYLVLDQNITISSQVGFPVNGILGYHFFKNHMVKINYATTTITIFRNAVKGLKHVRRNYVKMPLELINNKPYIIGTSSFEGQQSSFSAKFLLDTGNCDALWFFKQNDSRINIPKKTIEDFLGIGFSGEIFGKRGKIMGLELSKFKFSNPIAAFPDTIATCNLDKNIGRIGSIGSEIIRRFTMVLNYKANEVYFKKNHHFDDPFHFNMSGIEIQHKGLQWISSSYEDNPTLSNNLFKSSGEKIINNLKYRFELKPIYVITNIRKNSPAAIAGLQKEDIIVTIDKKNAYNFTLQEINELLKSEEGKLIEIEIDRNGKTLKFKIQLQEVY